MARSAGRSKVPCVAVGPVVEHPEAVEDVVDVVVDELTQACAVPPLTLSR
jgi:hypothetical protein